MNFQNLERMAADAVKRFGGFLPLTPLDAGAYESMGWPRLLPVMRFSVKRYGAAGFGNVFSMTTRAMGGLMRLCTLCFTPNLGTDMPLLLLDVMAMGKKRAVFVEYYDLTAEKRACPALRDVAGRYGALADYPEKPAWYVGERTGDSLIKGGTDEGALLAMLADSVEAYGRTAAERKTVREENLPGLRAFISRMVSEGNPSSATMERVLGKAGAEAFFRDAVMPETYFNGSESNTGRNAG